MGGVHAHQDPEGRQWHVQKVSSLPAGPCASPSSVRAACPGPHLHPPLLTPHPPHTNPPAPSSYSIAYFVFEKDAPCSDYPPDQITTFYDVQIQYDGRNVPAVWSTGIVDNICDFKAHVVNPSTSGGEVTITWNTKAADPPQAMIDAAQADRTLGRVPPSLRA
jgi:hypothetical protein